VIPFLDVPAMGDRQAGEDQQCGDLDDVDGDVDAGGANHADVGDVGNSEGEDDPEYDHQYRAVHGRGELGGKELTCHVAYEDGGDADHHAGVNPVVQVTGPADDEFIKACPLKGGFFGEERLLGEEIAGAGARIELGQFRVRDGCCQTE